MYEPGKGGGYRHQIGWFACERQACRLSFTVWGAGKCGGRIGQSWEAPGCQRVTQLIQCCDKQVSPFRWVLLKAVHNCLRVTGPQAVSWPRWERLCNWHNCLYVGQRLGFTFLPLTLSPGCGFCYDTLNLSCFICEMWTAALSSIYWEWVRKQTWKGI